MRLRAATHDDLAAVRQLLSASGLPLDGVEDNFGDFIVAEENDGIAGVIGLERYGSAALLRSAAVSPESRNTGVGRRLVREILDRASAAGVREIYLMTTTAEDYFPRFGFTRSTRTQVPEAVRASREFKGACPETAVVMKRVLTA
jgi:amino-acid N-acetyltransferase